MKEFYKYIFVLSAILTTACQKQINTPDVISAEGGLVSFSTKVETKAPIIVNLYNKTFGVYGFGFSNLTQWGTVKAKATPNEFYNQLVSCDNTGACAYTYTPSSDEDPDSVISGRKKWQLDQKYSFFAYYPYTTSNEGNYVISSAATPEVPFVEYTLPLVKSGTSDTYTVDPANLLDIMTAKVIDHSIVLGPVVGFNFYHRLFCIDIEGINHDPNDVTVSDISLTISGIQYNKSRIYMDRDRTVYDETLLQDISQPSIPSVVNDFTKTSSVTFSPIIPDNNNVVLKQGLKTALSGGDNMIMLIPQNSENEANALNVTVNFKKNGEEDSASTSFNLDFKEGRKYTLTMNFIGDEVQLITASEANWDTADDVDHVFD